MPVIAPRPSAATARDTHRSAVYAAEDALARQLDRGGRVEFFGSTLTLPIERRFADVPSIQRYVDRVITVMAMIKAHELPPIRVREREGLTKAHYEVARGDASAVIAVPLALVDGRRWAARESVVLHEIAHHVARHDPAAADEPAHGPAFCGQLLALHNEVIGPESALLLRASLASSGVPVRESGPR